MKGVYPHMACDYLPRQVQLEPLLAEEKRASQKPWPKQVIKTSCIYATHFIGFSLELVHYSQTTPDVRERKPALVKNE